MQDINKHLKYNRAIMLEYNNLIMPAKHKGMKGTAKELLIANFLSLYLPESIKYCTGEIIDSFDNTSGQIDIVLYTDKSFRFNLYDKINRLPCESVLASIEVKSTVDSKELKKILESCKKLKNLCKIQQSKQQFDDHAIISKEIPYILFAFDGLSAKSLTEALEKKKKEWNINQLPDFIIFLKSGKKDGYVLQKKDNVVRYDEFVIYEKPEYSEEPLAALLKFMSVKFEEYSNILKYYPLSLDEYIKRPKNEYTNNDFDEIFK